MFAHVIRKGVAFGVDVYSYMLNIGGGDKLRYSIHIEPVL